MSKNSNTNLETKLNKEESDKKKFFEKLFDVFWDAKLFWTALSILVILFIMSVAVLSFQLYDFIKIDDRSISLRSSMDESLDVFAMEYENASSEITVKGNDGTKVIAPGTSVEYTLRLRNTDKVALDYSFVTEITFTSDHELPVVIRLLDPEDKYVIGSATKWVPINKAGNVEHQGTLLANQTAEYEFQWKWPFESGDDAYDTFLGSIAEEDVRVVLTLTVHAKANIDAKYNGGWFSSPVGRLVLLIIVVLLLAIAIALLLIYIINKKREKEGKEPILAETFEATAPVIEAISRAVDPNTIKYIVQGKAYCVNLAQLRDVFESGDKVNLQILKEKGLVPKHAKKMKILSKESYIFDKALIIETEAISANARKAIIEAGGKVIIVAPNTKRRRKK